MTFDTIHEVHPRTWAALRTLSRVRHLALDVMPSQVPQLAQLPAALEVLRVNVAEGLDDSVEVAWRPEELRGKPDMCRVLEAAGRLPRLRSLHTNAPGMDLHHGAQAARLGARICALEAQDVSCYNLQLHDIAVLAHLPGLRHLYAWDLSGNLPGILREAYEKLVEQHASRGVEIMEVDTFDNTFTLAFEDDRPCR